MKKLMVGILLFAFGATASAAQNPFRKASGIKAEQVKQEKRIKHGLLSGKLTKREAIRLEVQQAKIKHHTWFAKADGVITPREGRHIKKELKRANRNIYIQSHDSQRR